MTTVLKALTLSQPWATLAAAGVKRIESRSWMLRPATAPKQLTIHAGKGIDRMVRVHITDRQPFPISSFREPYASALRSIGFSDLDPWQRHYAERCADSGYNPLPLGAIVGAVTLSDIRPADVVTTAWKRGAISELEYRLGDYSAGRFAWMFDAPIQFAQPIPYPGAQGLWKVSPPEAVDIERLVDEARRDR